MFCINDEVDTADEKTHELCRGVLLAIVSAIVGSLDVVMGEIDRQAPQAGGWVAVEVGSP